MTPSTLHRAPVCQGPSGPDWLAISLGFWSGRALATGTAWAGLCLINHHFFFGRFILARKWLAENETDPELNMELKQTVVFRSDTTKKETGFWLGVQHQARSVQKKKLAVN